MNTQGAQVKEIVSRHLPARLKFLKEIVEQNSHTENTEGVNRVQDLLEQELKVLGFGTKRTSCELRGEILTTHRSSTSSPLLLVGHADTVHAPSEEYNKFDDTNGILTGPGIFDMKSGLIVMLLALDALKELGVLEKVPVELLINSSEENSTSETIEKIASLAKHASGALVFEIGRPEGGVVLERKGIIELWCEAVGKEAHSGNNFYDGTNAILPLCRIAQKAVALVDDQEGVTVNIGQLHGGAHLCVVPGSAKLGIEVRAGTRAKQQEILEKIRSFAAEEKDVTIRVDTFTGPLNKTPESEKLFAAFQEAAKEVDFIVKALPRVGGLSDANILSSVNVPTIDALGPTGGKAHTREEFVNKDSIVPRAAAVAMFLLKHAA